MEKAITVVGGDLRIVKLVEMLIEWWLPQHHWKIIWTNKVYNTKMEIYNEFTCKKS